MNSAIKDGLAEVWAAARAWSGSLGLRALAMPAGLEQLTGELRGAPVTMTTRREQGGPFAALTCATICEADGGLHSTPPLVAGCYPQLHQ